MPRGRTLTGQERLELQREAAGLGRGGIKIFAETHARILGCSEATIRRAIAGVVDGNRQRRRDSGSMRALSPQDFEELAARTAKFDYPAELAIDVVNAEREERGDPLIEVSPETLRRQLRLRRVSRRDNAQDLRIHRRWEAPYPGYLQQIDATIAAQYYLDTDESVAYEPSVARNKNKPGNRRPRLHLIGVVDDHSRVLWARGHLASTSFTWIEALKHAWGRPADPERWPAYGIPQRLYSDQDSTMKSAVMTRALQQLGVERLLAKPSTEHFTNAQAKGKIERALGIIVHNFEVATRQQRFTSLDEFNQALERFLVVRNRRPHSTTKTAPFERWLEGTDQVRVLPSDEIMRLLSFREDRRIIDRDLSIRLGGKVYQLPQTQPFVDYAGLKVPVCYLEHDPSSLIVILENQEHEVAAVEAVPDVAGEFKAAAVPAAIELRKELLEREVAGDPHKVWEYRERKTATRYAKRPPEIEHERMAAKMSVPVIAWGKAVDRAQRAGVMSAPPTAAERASLESLFAGRAQVPKPEFEQWIQHRGGSAAPGENDQAANA